MSRNLIDVLKNTAKVLKGRAANDDPPLSAAERAQLTLDSIGDAELFFNSVFAPVCMMRGYSEHWHRHGAIYVIAETSIEIPLPCGLTFAPETRSTLRQ